MRETNFKVIARKAAKYAAGIILAAAVAFMAPTSVKADEMSDIIAAQQQALQQQQAQALQLQQLQQAAAMQAYQAALAAQYQAMADQYAKALIVYQQAQVNQINAIQQAYMLNAIQAQQNAQYQSMVQNTGLDYKQHLMDEYKKYQELALTAFKGYEGIY